jgi:hypothetical protein
MNKLILTYTLRLAVMTVMLGILTFAFVRIFRTIPVTPAYVFVLGFLFVFSWLAFYTTAKSMQKKISRFANTYMVINFLKLLIFSLFLLAYAYLNRDDAAPFIITFFVYYIFYTVLEVIGLKELNSRNKKESENGKKEF